MLTSRYQRALAVVGVLATAILLMVGVGLYLSGPRIRYTSFDNNPKETQLTRGKTLTVRFDRPIEQNDYTQSISFSPEVTFSTQTLAQSIDITFTENLESDTLYTLTLAPMVADGTGRKMKNAYSYSFETGPSTYMYLERNYPVGEAGVKADDVIKKAIVGLEPEVVFSAQEINMFTTNEEYLVVATRSGNRLDKLQTVDLKNGNVREENLIYGGWIDNLTMSANGKVALFTVTPYFTNSEDPAETISNRLVSLNVETGQMGFVNKTSSQFMRALDIKFSDDGFAAVVQAPDLSFYAVSPFNDYDPILLGVYNETFGFNDDGSKILFRNSGGFVEYDIASSQAKPISYPEVNFTQSAFIKNNRYYVVLSGTSVGEPISYIESLTRLDASDRTVEWLSADTNMTYRDLAVSYDGKYIAVQQDPQGCSFDQINTNPQCKETATAIYTSRGDEPLNTLEGFDLVWLP